MRRLFESSWRGLFVLGFPFLADLYSHPANRQGNCVFGVVWLLISVRHLSVNRHESPTLTREEGSVVNTPAKQSHTVSSERPIILWRKPPFFRSFGSRIWILIIKSISALQCLLSTFVDHNRKHTLLEAGLFCVMQSPTLWQEDSFDQDCKHSPPNDIMTKNPLLWSHLIPKTRLKVQTMGLKANLCSYPNGFDFHQHVLSRLASVYCTKTFTAGRDVLRNASEAQFTVARDAWLNLRS